jgi:hypothetical protein
VDWQKRAGKPCQQVPHGLVEQGKVETHHIQADEIRAKGRKMVAWMGLALDARSRLWMAGVVSLQRDRERAERLVQQVPACWQLVQALLVPTSGGSLNCSVSSVLQILGLNQSDEADLAKQGYQI